MDSTGIGLIVDAAVVVVLVLLIIFGTWRGMYKLIYGLVSGLLSIVLAIVLAGTVTGFIVEKTELETALNGALNQPVQKAIPEELHASDIQVTYTEDGVTIVDKEGNTYETVSEYVNTTESSLKPVASLLDSLVNNESVRANYTSTDEDGNFVSETSPTLADLLCVTVTTYVLLALVFIALWIVAYIVLRLLMLLLKKIVTKTYVGHFLNKMLGFIIGAAVGMLIIWGALAVIRLLGTYTWIIAVNNVINSSTLTKWLYENNYLYTFLVETMDLQGTIAKIIGSFSGNSGSGA
ncbi:MAG: CvpA family protein [Clostridia bacterium]|nr:CvpA family protein [Clostridia bacterium]